jgi:hypothetical protein
MNPQCRCGCCAGVTDATPTAVDNRPGLPEVHDRPGTYAEFRAGMHAALTSSARPALAGLTTRDDDDFTIGLLDATACVADVLTFYTERLVNEAYLGTATDRVSLAELGKLVGYRLRPGAAAATSIAFYVEPPPPTPVSAATSPFRQIRQPTSVTIPAGTAVRSVPGPGEQPQTFETSAPIDASPQWNLMAPVTTKPTILGTGATSLYVSGVTANLKPGDMLLFDGAAGWEIRPIATATTQGDRQRTLVTWSDPLTKAAPLTPYVMRKKLGIFGANAPMWKSMSTDFKTNYGGVDDPDWPAYYITVAPADWANDHSWYLKVDLDGAQPDIAAGSHIIMVTDSMADHFTVSSRPVEMSRAEFALSGKATRLALDGDLGQWYDFFTLVRETTVYAVSEELVLAEEPDTSAVSGGWIRVLGDVGDLPAGRTLLVAGDGQVEPMTLQSAVADATGTTLSFTSDLNNSYTRATLAIFGNIAAVTHGETVQQILGDGQAAQTFQTFTLRSGPLTFVPSDDPSGATSTLQVRVNDVLWHEVPSLYPAAPADRVFVTRDRPDGSVEVGTGDGLRGTRVATGQNNVRAVYRKGIGVAGNLPAGALTQLSSPPLGVTGVTNPAPSIGGADPDTVDHARAGIPLYTRTLGRAVSLTDYADFARTFAGIAKAAASVLAIRHVRTIMVTVAGADGAVVPDEVGNRLVTALRDYGDPLVPVLVLPHRPVPIELRMTVRRDPDYDLTTVLTGVAARLTAAFGFGARDFTQPVARSEVIAAAQGATGVVAVDLTYLYRDDPPANLPRLLAAGPELVWGQPQGAELLLLTNDPIDWLAEMP